MTGFLLMRRAAAGLGLDVRLALRLLRKEPGFALLSIAMIALAIASATSLFSVVNGVLLEPLPRVRMEGLVRVFEVRTPERDEPAFSNVTYYAWVDRPETIVGIGVWNDWSMSFEGPSGLEVLHGAKINASLFPIIGVRPTLGLNFTEAQEVTDEAVILSHGFWQKRFGEDPSVIGKRMTIGGRVRTIIGVMPRGFAFPDRETRVWLAQRPPVVVTYEGKHSTSLTIASHNALARLKPGVTLEQAGGEAAARVKGVAAFKHALKSVYGEEGTPKIVMTPMLDWIVKDVKPALWILSAAVMLLFAAAIGNVANMQLARVTAREREVAIRAAIGAGGGRLLRQLLVETSLVTALGAAIGLGITVGLLRVLPRLMPEDFPRLDDIAVDGRVLAMAAGLTVLVSLVIGLLPARMARRVKLTTALAEDSAPVGHSLRSPAARSRAVVITAQVAIAALLLVGAGLLSKSLLILINIDRGYEPSNLLTARVGDFSREVPASARPVFYREVLDRLIATPGVTHAALSTGIPLTPKEMSAHGHPTASPALGIKGELSIVSSDYFATMGMRFVRGRGFTSDDLPTSELVVLVNETFARRYLPGDSLDARVSLDFNHGRPCEPTRAERSACTSSWRVIGILKDVRRSGFDASVQPEVFVPRAQVLAALPATQYVTVRTSGNPAHLGARLREIVKTVSANGVVDQLMTMESRLMTSLARPRLFAALLGGFATFSLLIAVIGLFGSLSYAVALRSREIGVRTALGATPRDIVRMVMAQGSIITVCGLVTGLGAAAATVRYLSAFLSGVEPLDVLTFAVVGSGVFVVASVACAIPARRAASIDALEALRR